MARITTAAALLLCLLFTAPAQARHHRHSHHHHSLPWCGIYLSKYFGKSDRRLWIAREWAREGAPASPGVGAVVVWSHHVGVIVGGSPGRWQVHSGNDSGAVRTRVRSVAGAIAFRRV
jgi:hypothetical protein